MHTLVVASRKGGAGKTTTSAALAVAAERAGHGPVALIDTDEQGSLAKWWNKRQADTPVFARASIDQLGPQLQALDQAGIKLTIIDTAPGMNEESKQKLLEILPHADLVLIPSRPSPLDLEAIGDTITLAEQAGKNMIFVINGAANRAKITGDAAILLSQHGKVSPVTLYQRTDFATSMIDGRTVLELDSQGNSAKEVEALWDYVAKQLAKF